MDEAKNRINNLEHKEPKNNHIKQEEVKRIQNNESTINSFRGNFNSLIGVPDGEEKE